MKKYLIPVLTIVLCAAVLLGAAFGLQGVAEKNAPSEHLRLLETLAPGSENFTVIPYEGEDGNIRSIHKGETGYVIETVTQGYAGEITLLVGVNNDGKVVGLMVRSMHETFGLGAQALTDTNFLSSFLFQEGIFSVVTEADKAYAGEVEETEEKVDAASGATGETALPEDSDLPTVEVDALTGATVTSKAIVRGVNSAVLYVLGPDAAASADAATGATS